MLTYLHRVQVMLSEMLHSTLPATSHQLCLYLQPSVVPLCRLLQDPVAKTRSNCCRSVYSNKTRSNAASQSIIIKRDRSAASRSIIIKQDRTLQVGLFSIKRDRMLQVSLLS